ncbi:MAG: hypothetical protein KDA60_04560 [Planctomycetales bacterium]|nr:hypothetical protein [Planctomycetales bacterium]
MTGATSGQDEGRVNGQVLAGRARNRNAAASVALRWGLIRRVALVVLVLWAPRLAAAAQPPVTSLALSHDETELLVGSQAGVIVKSYPELKESRKLMTELVHVHDIQFSPDGTLVALAGGKPSIHGEVEIRRWPDGELVVTCGDFKDLVYALSWRADGRYLAAVSGDGRGAVWQTVDWTQTRQLQGHSQRVVSVCWLPGEEGFVTASMDATLRVWKLDEADAVRILANHTDGVVALAVNPNTPGPVTMASGSRDRSIRIWQPAIGRLVRFARLERAEPLALAWSPDGHWLIASATDGHAYVIDPATAEIKQDLAAVPEWGYSVVVTSQGEAIVGGLEGELRRVALPNAFRRRD